MNLPVRQQRFVAEYAVRRNGAAAARAAGYAPGSAKVTASRLLTKANVKRALDAYERAARRRLGITRDRVLAELQTAIETAKQLGQPMTEIAGWREIAKICGLYKDAEPPVTVVSSDAARLHAKILAMSDQELFEAAVLPNFGRTSPSSAGRSRPRSPIRSAACHRKWRCLIGRPVQSLRIYGSWTGLPMRCLRVMR